MPKFLVQPGQRGNPDALASLRPTPRTPSSLNGAPPRPLRPTLHTGITSCKKWTEPNPRNLRDTATTHGASERESGITAPTSPASAGPAGAGSPPMTRETAGDSTDSVATPVRGCLLDLQANLKENTGDELKSVERRCCGVTSAPSSSGANSTLHSVGQQVHL